MYEVTSPYVVGADRNPTNQPIYALCYTVQDIDPISIHQVRLDNTDVLEMASVTFNRMEELGIP